VSPDERAIFTRSWNVDVDLARRGSARIVVNASDVSKHHRYQKEKILALEERGLKVTRCTPARTRRYNHLDSLCECVGSDAGSGSESSMEVPC